MSLSLSGSTWDVQGVPGLLHEAVGAATGSPKAVGCPSEPVSPASSCPSPTRRGTAPSEAWELALETWSDLEPSGYAIEEQRIRDRLPAVASRIPRLTRDCTKQLFEPSSPSAAPLFVQLLQPRGGKVEFLFFWKAFGEAMQMTGVKKDSGLTAEVELVRDKLLRRSMVWKDYRVPFEVVLAEIRSAAGMSESPAFWLKCAGLLKSQADLGTAISVQDLTCIVLSWLHESQLWAFGIGCEIVLSCDLDVASRKGPPVYLHVYDVSQDQSIQSVNFILAHKDSPVKFGGIFHAGVEVHGREWSYGCTTCMSLAGVSSGTPRGHPHHAYRQTIQLNCTNASAEKVAEIIATLSKEYPGPDYHLLRRNCCHFAEDFCRRLGAGSLPPWIHRLARLAAGLEAIMQTAPVGLSSVFSI